ncbi:hypothetical protein SK803_23895 [Lentzea sp. BCCO 10_0856]|uniref:Uncharacterized protein n=1 Tax=Lentzea miocenica TaxID=3095431 RepID=A0ABU4T528_9PSEU|nr:hypothetical protein [Lentzea sp. BCCO 10_0856]MDX8033272.1 hypothetical protein [Lentzea sp. BCCO 10_0856]
MPLFRKRDTYADPIPLSPELAGFSGKVARLERDRETSGYLCLKRDVVAQKGEERPHEVLELNVVTVDSSGAATEYVQEIYDETEAQHELTTGVFRLRGIDYAIVWLDDANAAAVLAEFF